MEFEAARAKGILDRSFPSVKIALHKDSSYEEINIKCAETVWTTENEDAYDYYLADGGGTAIGASTIRVDFPDEKGSKSLPWTLSNYLRVSNIKFASRLRIYSVRKFKHGN